jgi:hypothetical protein
VRARRFLRVRRVAVMMLLQTHSRERAGGVTLLVMLAAYSELRLRCVFRFCARI